MHRRAALAAVLALVIGGCASMRKVEVGSGSSASAAVYVNNARNSIITVSYTDGGTTRQLGDVSPGATQRFVVVAQGSTIEVYARTTAGTTLGPYTVSVTGGGGQTITIR